MAPQYAPNLRSLLGPVLLFLQTAFILIAAFCLEINNNETLDGTFYAEFQDVNVMVVLGFGFLSTFLVRYGFSGSGFNLLVTAIATQWAIILTGVESWYERGKIRVDLKSILSAEICAACALVSMGTVLGKTNPVQLILIALFNVSGFVLNEWILRTLLSVRPLNSLMQLHVFGAFFGLMLTWILQREGTERGFEKEKFDRKSGLFSMLGSVFLWMFWPSFNGVLVDSDRKLGAVCGSYLALAASGVTAAALSSLSSRTGKLNLIQMQPSILAGGVSVGVAVSVVDQPWVAMATGVTAALLSAAGFRYLKPQMHAAFECHDTRGTLSTHGLPGLLGWFLQLLLQIRKLDQTSVAIRFSVFHISTLFITVSTSLTTGILTGFLLKWNFWRPPQNKKCFDDQAFWEFPHNAVRK
ncbi:ammonium transporter Rh type C-like [Menidia menidia]